MSQNTLQFPYGSLKLIPTEFVENRNDNAASCSNVVARAESEFEVSSPVPGIRSWRRSATSKCEYTNSTTGSTMLASCWYRHE
ncbi:hypothetical protein GGS21DRAFT_196936 [Xylaria nigripes]|nr:hypothetical protein GGS21DRAFT_196936 [Xylaria nigripes]